MAGDWIKLRIDLQSHPKVVRILSATRTDKFRVIGGLHSVWSVFDLHSEDGRLKGYTPEALDHVIGWDGFARAMESVGWLQFDGLETLMLPEFDEHNGQSAKRRAEDQKRKRNGRNSVRNLSAPDADTMRTREEKRREEKKEPKAGVVDAGFDSFWEAYPRKVAKQDAAKAFSKLAPDAALVAQMLAAIKAQSSSEAWTKDGGKFVPHPATWINGKRWTDDAGSTGGNGEGQWFEGAI